MLKYGTQEFFDHLKTVLNADPKFRDLGTEEYTVTELIVIKDLNVGIWQNTVKGEIKEFRLVPKKEVKDLENKAELMYYIDNYETMVKITTGEAGFVALVIEDAIVFRGSLKKVIKIQGPSERMEIIIKDLCKRAVIPTKIQYQKWLAENGYI